LKLARIELWNGDICELEVDAIVNAANLSLWMSTGVGGALKRAGGDSIEFAAVRQAPCRSAVRSSPRPATSRPRPSSTPVSLDRDRRTSGPVIESAVRSAMARAREIGGDEHRLSGARHGRRRVPARGGGQDHGLDRSRRAREQPHDRARDLRPARRQRVPRLRRRASSRHPRRSAARREHPVREREDQRDELVEQVAREIQLRGLTGPAVHFLEASRPYRALGANAMLFFDPVLRGLFGGDLASASEILADDTGIELLIARLEETDEETDWDA
jgi:hypothetical protein